MKMTAQKKKWNLDLINLILIQYTIAALGANFVFIKSAPLHYAFKEGMEAFEKAMGKNCACCESGYRKN